MDDREILLKRLSELEQSERYFRTLYESTVDAVLLIDAEQGIFDCNPASVSMFRATSRDKLCQLHLTDLATPYQSGWLPSHDLIVHHLAEACTQGHVRFDWQARRLDKSQFPAHVTLITIDMPERRIAQVIIRDHTAQKQQELEMLRIRKELESANKELQVTMEQLQLAASTDQLTSVWNRRFFNSVITTERARAARTGNPLTLMLVDVDYFKTINDTHGHLVGDQVLVEMAMVLQESLRATDYLIRWGGEEFAILTPELDQEQATKLAERLRQRIASHTFVEDLTLTISAGVAQLKDNDILSRWLSRADNALYAAKHSGRNRVIAAA